MAVKIVEENALLRRLMPALATIASSGRFNWRTVRTALMTESRSARSHATAEDEPPARSHASRAAMILAFISGLQLFRKVIARKALTNASRSDLYASTKATFQRLIDPD